MSSDQRLGLAAELVPARQQLPENSSTDTWWKSRSRERRSDESQPLQPPCAAAPPGKHPRDNAGPKSYKAKLESRCYNRFTPRYMWPCLFPSLPLLFFLLFLFFGLHGISSGECTHFCFHTLNGAEAD